jgi:hypothetical protein
MRPGSLNQQYTVCGKDGCRCVDPDRPKKHGPYYQLSYVHDGKSTTQFIGKKSLEGVRQQLKNYKKFRELTTEWVDRAGQAPPLAAWDSLCRRSRSPQRLLVKPGVQAPGARPGLRMKRA